MVDNRNYIRRQAPLQLDDQGDYGARPDILIHRYSDHKVACVIDTKYKVHAAISNSDIYQITTYAAKTGAPLGVLLYPVMPAKPFSNIERGMRVEAMSFDIAGEIEEAGKRFLTALLAKLSSQYF